MAGVLGWADVQEEGARYRHGMLLCSVDGTGMVPGKGGLETRDWVAWLGPSLGWRDVMGLCVGGEARLPWLLLWSRLFDGWVVRWMGW